MKTLRLILLPTLVTLAVSAMRLTGEVQGWVHSQSGGALHLLGISWLPFAFGPLFAVLLVRDGSRPRLRAAWPWGLIALGLLAAAVMWRFGPLLSATDSDETWAMLRSSVVVLVAIAVALAASKALVWPRLAWTLLCYAIPARVAVVAITWLAKHMEWETHYTKFGPPGMERDMGTTLVSASIAQLGFWTPYTIIAGFVFGAMIGRRGREAA